MLEEYFRDKQRAFEALNDTKYLLPQSKMIRRFWDKELDTDLPLSVVGLFEVRSYTAY